MKVKMIHETGLDDLRFGYINRNEDFVELEVKEGTTDFEKACIESFDALKYTMREELVELAKRVEELENWHKSWNGPL